MADRSAERVALGAVTAVVTAPLDRVVDLVFSVRSGPVGPDNAALLHAVQESPAMEMTGGPEHFETRLADGHSLQLVLFREARIVRIQGQWWYRGEYTFDAHPEGTLMTYRIYNLARLPDLVIKMWQHSLLRRQQDGAEALAQTLSNRLI